MLNEIVWAGRGGAAGVSDGGEKGDEETTGDRIPREAAQYLLVEMAE